MEGFDVYRELEKAVWNYQAGTIIRLFNAFPQHRLPLSAIKMAGLAHAKFMIEEHVIPLDYNDGETLLHSLIPGTAHYQMDIIYRAIFCYLLEAKADVNARMGENQVCSYATPLEYALEARSDWAITKLLKAGASVTNFLQDEVVLKNGWFSYRTSCQASVVAFLAANKCYNFRLPKDVVLLIAKKLWTKRYSMSWVISEINERIE
jgi:hypothetical protein